MLGQLHTLQELSVIRSIVVVVVIVIINIIMISGLPLSKQL